MSPLLTLAIETSNPSAPSGPGCALGEVGGGHTGVIDAEPLRTAARHDDDLLPCIDRLCRRAGVRPVQLRLVAVSVGPGGYTALRVAVAAAKLIAEAAGAKCAAVPTAVSVLLATRPAAGPVGVALAGKADSSHVTVFPAGVDARAAVRAPGGTLVDAKGLAAFHLAALIADEHLPAPLRAEAARLNLPVIPTVFDPCAVLAAAAHVPHLDPIDLLPLYAREPEAVTLWRQRKRG